MTATSRTVVFGAGFLGTRLARSIPGAHLSTADICDAAAVRAELAGAHVAINAAGKTGTPNVDWCESHQAETYRSNVVGALTLADECARRGVHLVHLGSGCVYYGDSPRPGGFREDDFANPSSFYSRTKYAADLVLSQLPGVAIARLRMPIDAEPGPRNLITKLASYSQVIDVENSVTVVDDLVLAVEAIAQRRLSGVFHVVNDGTMRHADLLALYRELVDPELRAVLIPEGELVARGLAVKARSNCILHNQRLREHGIVMRPIGVALRDCMTRYARSVRRASVEAGTALGEKRPD